MHHQLRATGTHLSLIAHITQRELTQTFQRHQAHSFANRCLWTWVERGNCFPGGGTAPADELSAIAGSVHLFDLATGDPVADRTAKPSRAPPTASRGIRSIVSSMAASAASASKLR